MNPVQPQWGNIKCNVCRQSGGEAEQQELQRLHLVACSVDDRIDGTSTEP